MIEAFHEYVAEIQDRRFEWGVHDCFTYTNEAWRRMHGEPWAPGDWTGCYVDGGRVVGLHVLRSRFPCYGSIGGALDTILDPLAGLPPRGALVALYGGEGRARLGVGFGIADGMHGVFLDIYGTRAIPLTDVEFKAWGRKCC